MRIWFDADNAPHVPVMKPVAELLRKQGHQVRFTARDRANTCQLLDMYRLEYTRVGSEYGVSSFGKAFGTLKRAFLLMRAMRDWGADVSFGHGSRALPIASGLMGIPGVTMYDYEWVDPVIFNRFCRIILLPVAITPERCREAGIKAGRVRFFPGFKENLYLGSAEPDPSIPGELGLDPGLRKILLRPPATTAHYHDPQSEEILAELLDNLLEDREVQLIWIPRTGDQNHLVSGSRKARVIIPEKVYPGLALIMEMDMVIGGGGTMTREAALLGVPSVTFFRGRLGAVDETLQGMKRLTILEKPEDVSGLFLNPPEPCGRITGTPETLEHIAAAITCIG
jgi:predicted glycosyltransferase